MGENMVLFKSSVVVGLGGALPRGVNKLILQFLGIPKKKTAEELKTIIEENLRDGEEPENYMKDLLIFCFDTFVLKLLWDNEKFLLKNRI